MRTLLIAATILVATAGSSFAQGKPEKPTAPTTSTAIAPPTIVDATGKAVGIYNSEGIALFKFTGGVIAIAIEPVVEGGMRHSSRLRYSQYMNPYYASGDCSGVPIPMENTSIRTPLGASNIWGPRPAAYVMDSGGQVTAHIATSSLATPRSVNSFRRTDGSCGVLTSPEIQNGYDVGTTLILPPAPLTVQ